MVQKRKSQASHATPGLFVREPLGAFAQTSGHPWLRPDPSGGRISRPSRAGTLGREVGRANEASRFAAEPHFKTREILFDAFASVHARNADQSCCGVARAPIIGS
jgi:hypothetical protein